MSEHPRLSVNIGESTVDVLRDLRGRFGWTATEAVRQAFSLLAFAVDAYTKGERLAVISSDGREVREVLPEWQVRQ